MPIPQTLPPGRCAAALANLAVLALVGLGCATTPTAVSPAPAATTPAADRAAEAPPPPAPSEPAAAPEVAAAAVANDDVVVAAEPAREWLTDDQGRRYYLDTYPKSYAHRRIDDTHVRTAWGIDIEVEREDETSFFFRIYEADPTAKGPGPGREPATAEMKASFEVDVPKVDRLTFAPFDKGLPRNAQWRQGSVVADMNGDGKLDIVHGPPRKVRGAPLVFLGDGQGNWKRWASTWPDFPYDYGDVAVGDLDADGRLDVVLAAHLHGVVALFQRQPGVFELANQGLPYRMRSDEKLGFSSRAVELLDWDRDGRLDIAALNEGPIMEMNRAPTLKDAAANASAMIYLNQGGGSWQGVALGTDTGRVQFGDHLATGDLDGDRRPDLLASTNLYGRQDILFLNERKGLRHESLEAVRPAYVRSVAVDDFDADGAADVALGFLSSELAPEWRTGIDVLYRTGKGWRRSLVWVENERLGLWSLDAGDIDGDRRRDLVGITGDARFIVLLGDGKGGFARQEAALVKVEPGCRGYGVTLADLDGDGSDEIIASFAGERSGVPGLLEEPGCQDGGSLRVWKAAAKPH